MKVQVRAKAIRRILYAAILAGLLYSAPAMTTKPASAQYPYPYGCDCTKLYSEAHGTCSSRGGLTYYTCRDTYNGRAGSFTCGDGSQWTNSCTN